MSHTIFTPTYNRVNTLVRLYESIRNQTSTDFIWLIIDDGSTDGTQDLVKQWEAEGRIAIKYIYKPNGGKHTAMEMAYAIANTKYIVGVDSDDTLLPNTIQLFENAWSEIETLQLEDQIAQVKLFTMYKNGDMVGYGDYKLPDTTTYLDASWHEFVLKQICYRELIDSTNLSKMQECVNIDKYQWHKSELRFIGESIFWASIGRKYKTRMINAFGRIYYTDSLDSILRREKTKQDYVNNMVNNMYFVDENIEYFLLDPNFFTTLIVKYLISGFIVKESPVEQFKIITKIFFKFLYVLFFLPSLLYYFILKCFHKQYYLGEIKSVT